MTILAFVFAVAWFVTGVMAAHLPRLLEIAGAGATAAIGAGAGAGCGWFRRARSATPGASADLGAPRRHAASDQGGNA